ncbi:hypothetical protein JCM14036_04060 [Desulfotomaculum defluvii]
MQYRLKNFSVYLVTVFLFTLMLSLMTAQSARAATDDSQEMVRLINEARSKAGLTALMVDQQLSLQAAKNLEYYQRTGQSPSSTMLLDIAKSGGYSTIGQTIVRSNDVATMVQKQLVYYGSRSILNAKYNRIGLAFMDTSSGKICVQLLGYKPITEPIEKPEQPVPQPEPTPQPEPAAPQPEPEPQPEPQPVPQEPTSFMNDFQKQVVNLVNAERAKYGLQPLVAKEDLTKVAQAKAQDMYQSRYFSHTSPNYGSPFDMMRKFGISYLAAGENIAMGQKTPEQVMQDWMNSSGHRANILNAKYNEIGVGVYQSYSGYGYIWVQEFARR